MTTKIELPEMDEEVIDSIFDAADFGDGETIEAIVKDYAEKAVLFNLRKNSEKS